MGGAGRVDGNGTVPSIGPPARTLTPGRRGPGLDLAGEPGGRSVSFPRYLPPTRVDQHLAIGIATERSGTTRPKGRTSSGAPARSPRTAGPPRLAAVGETVILLHPSIRPY